MEFEDLVEEEEPEIDYSQISVQELYRPVLKMKIPQGIPTKNEKDPNYQWWKEQMTRCLKGWIAPDGRYLNGYLYFYLNFCKIPIRIEGSSRFIWETPMYRDNDQLVLDQLWENTYRQLPNGKEIQAKNHIEGKPRGVAWTTLSLMGVCMWTFVFRNDAMIGLAFPNDEIKIEEQTWFIEGWTQLHPMFKRWKGRDLEIIKNNEKLFSVGYNVGAKNNKVINKIQFDTIGMETKAGVYKGKRLNLMIASEAGLWVGDALKNYYNENEPAIKLGDEQWGMCLIGGTSNLIINKSTAYREMFIQNHVYNATRHFTPKTMVLRGHINYHTGISNQETARAQIMADRASKVDDQIAYQQSIMENPLTWEEAFMAKDGLSLYNTAVINEQMNKIRMEGLEKYWRRGKIEYLKDRHNKNTKKVQFVPDRHGLPENERGDWLINLEGQPTPMYRNLYVAGIDDRYKSRAIGQKVKTNHSKNAMVIWRRETSYPLKSDIPCAVYFGDNPDMMIAYEEFYKGMLLYDVEKTLYENNAEGFIMFMRDYKRDIGRLYWNEGKGEYGLNVESAEVKGELTYLGNQFLSANREKGFTHSIFLQGMLDWGNKNTDVGSALHLVFKMLELTSEAFVTQVKNQEEIKQSHVIKVGIPQYYEDDDEPRAVRRIKLGPRSN